MATGLQLANEMEKLLGIKYKLGGETPEELDCQGAVECALRELGIEADYSGTNDMWRNMFSDKGTIEEGVEKYGEIPVGAAILIVDHDGGEPDRYQDDEGNCWHIYIKVSATQLIHASESNGYVVYRSFDDEAITGGPSHYGLIADITYEGISEASKDAEDTDVSWDGYVYASNGKPVKLRPNAGTDKPYLAKVNVGEEVTVVKELASGWLKVKYNGETGYMMAKFIVEELPEDWEEAVAASWDPMYDNMVFSIDCAGDGVREIQTGLNRLGYDLDVDGDFGPLTEAAVIKFQEEHGLEADGIVGKNTWASLIEEANKA